MDNAQAVNIGQHRQNLMEQVLNFGIREGFRLVWSVGLRSPLQHLAIGGALHIILNQKNAPLLLKGRLKLRNLRMIHLV